MKLTHFTPQQRVILRVSFRSRFTLYVCSLLMIDTEPSYLVVLTSLSHVKKERRKLPTTVLIVCHTKITHIRKKKSSENSLKNGRML